MTSNNAHLLIVNENVQIIQLHDEGKVQAKEFVKHGWFNCGKTHIYDTLKNTDHIINDWVGDNGTKIRKG